MGDARGREQRLPRYHDHHLAAAKALAEQRIREGGLDARSSAVVRLLRPAGALRQDRLDRDVRGGGRGVLARAGTIVGVASLADYRGFPSSQAYGPTKAAEINLLESLRIDLTPLSIDVDNGLSRLRTQRADGRKQLPDALDAQGR